MGAGKAVFSCGCKLSCIYLYTIGVSRTLKVRSTMVQALYCVMEYTIFGLVDRVIHHNDC